MVSTDKKQNTIVKSCSNLSVNTYSSVVNTFTVTNNNQTGPGSLHQPIIDSNNAVAADIITFSAAFTININGASDAISDAFPEINDNFTIYGNIDNDGVADVKLYDSVL